MNLRFGEPSAPQPDAPNKNIALDVDAKPPEPELERPAALALAAEPLSMERLQEIRANDPRVASFVEQDKASLRALPQLETPTARAEALVEAQGFMRAAVDAGDKQMERQLRIRVLALDDLAREPIAPPPPRPLPAPEAELRPVALDDATGPAEVSLDVQDKAAAETGFEVLEKTPPELQLSAESLPIHNVTELVGGLDLPERTRRQPVEEQSTLRHGNQQLDEPTERLSVPQLDELSFEGPPIHRLAALRPAVDPPTSRDMDLDLSTLPMPDRSFRMDTPAPPDAPPEARARAWPASSLLERSELAGPMLAAPGPDDEDMTVRGEVAERERSNPLFDDLDDAPPSVATPADTDPITAKGPHRLAPVVAAPVELPSVTQELSVADLMFDDDPRSVSTQSRFDSHFKLVVEDRPLKNALRGDVDRLDHVRARAAEGRLEARELAGEVDRRLKNFQQVDANASVEQLGAQYRTLAVDEARVEVTGNVHLADRLALAALHLQAERRQAALAATVAEDLMEELRSSPWDLDDVRKEAVVLMSSREQAFDEHPYNDRAFLTSELLRAHEVDPDYARVCALMLSAARKVNTSYLLYEIEQDPPAYAAAQETATRMLGRPAQEADDDVMRALSQARIDVVLARSEAEAASAMARAREAALVYDVLPLRRADEPTKPPVSRFAGNA